MTSTETITLIKDIAVIVFLVFTTFVIVFGSLLGIRLYWRVGRFMDRMERFTDGFEAAFGNVATARKALRPVVRGLGLMGLSRGIGRFFGHESSDLEKERR
ncbi:MAG: hypothetical protein O3B95_00170 [Chloroflexi bacterium]|nr:hypothetical protein [Chloroflexota bacterium]